MFRSLVMLLFVCSFGHRRLPAPGDALHPSDPQATPEARALYGHLARLLKTGVLFGHQDDPAYGVQWKYVPGRSDVREVTGDHPAVYGFELGRLETGAAVNLDSVPFDRMRGYIREAYARGGVITLSWHLNNPLTGGTAWEPAPGALASILPGGSRHAVYTSWLDRIAAFLAGLKGNRGEAIPIIFRPFHEWNGSWFWWGAAHSTPAELQQAYRFTVDYLRKEKGLHQLLFAFNSDRFASEAEYLSRYPGDDLVDVLGFDAYQRECGAAANETFRKDLDRMLLMLDRMAQDHGKLPALTEFGFNEVPDANWWTGVLGAALKRHAVSYALAWRNAGSKRDGTTEYYVPYGNQLSAADFRAFYRDPVTLFGKEISKEKIYK